MKYASAYLNFNGNAEEAFGFYRRAFGGEFSSVVRFKDMPGTEKLPAADREKVAHVALPLVGGFVLMGSDVMDPSRNPARPGTNTYVFLEAESREEADRLFAALSAGVKPEMPLQDTFWGAYFGSFTDRFGVQWMIEHTRPQAR